MDLRERLLDTVFQCGMSERRLPQLSVSEPLQSCCNLIYPRHRSSSELHHAELLECFLGAHAVFDGLPYQILLLHLLQSPAEHLLFSSARDHAYAINITEDDISRHYPDPTYLQRRPEVYDLSARGLILSVSSVGEGGKTQLEDPAGVAVVAVNDRSGGPEFMAGVLMSSPQSAYSGEAPPQM